MLTVRPSVPEDIPAQRELWKLAFGDSDQYIDNFYNTYYRPDRVVVLEEDGVVKSMTAWFDTTFVLPGQGEHRAAYLYAVATHPDCRGRGLAGKLLAGADEYFRSLAIPAPNLLRPASTEEYGRIRETLLRDIPHIAYPEDALAYQAGCCALGDGGLFVGDTPGGPICLCAERADDELVIVKECLGASGTYRHVFPDLPRIVPARQWEIRGPRSAEFCVEVNENLGKFGMLKWLDPELEKAWNWDTVGYLGLAFD